LPKLPAAAKALGGCRIIKKKRRRPRVAVRQLVGREVGPWRNGHVAVPVYQRRRREVWLVRPPEVQPQQERWPLTARAAGRRGPRAEMPLAQEGQRLLHQKVRHIRLERPGQSTVPVLADLVRPIGKGKRPAVASQVGLVFGVAI